MFKTTVTRRAHLEFPDIQEWQKLIVELGGSDSMRPGKEQWDKTGPFSVERHWPSKEAAAAYCAFMLKIDGVESAVVDYEVTE